MSAAPPAPEPGKGDGSPARPFRWQALFQRAGEAVFVLDRRRRLRFVNACWEQLTGLSAPRVRGMPCRRPRPPGPDDPLEQVLAHVLTPPPEALAGRFARVRRLIPAHARAWWDVEFLPLRQAGDGAGFFIVGRILPLPTQLVGTQALLPERLETIRQQHLGRFSLDLLTSACPASSRLVQQVRLATQVRTPVLLVGEEGTGKRTIGRIIHYQGRDRERAFAALDCRRLPPSAVADLLLAERSSATWRSLGAIYLNEPAHLPRDLQSRLADWLALGSETGPEATSGTAPRLFAGCSVPWVEEMRAGRLAESLYWQLGTLTLEVPPLRQRRADLPRLVEGFLTEPRPKLSPAAWEVFEAYAWPGNLRELRQVLDDARRRATGERIELSDLPLALRLARATDPPRATPRPLLLEEVLAQVERRLIGIALARAEGNRTRAAELLGIHRPRLLRRMEALGLADQPDPAAE